MEDGEGARGPALQALGDEVNHRLAVGDVERGGGLVEDEQRVLAGEAARDIDALLFAPEGGRRRQRATTAPAG